MEVNQCPLSPSFNSHPRSLSFPKRPVGGQVFTKPMPSRRCPLSDQTKHSKPIVGLPTQIANDKGRYHSLGSGFGPLIPARATSWLLESFTHR